MTLDLSKWIRENQTSKGKEFTVTYYAKVNAKADVTEKNEAKLEYGNDPQNTITTKPSEAKTRLIRYRFISQSEDRRTAILLVQPSVFIKQSRMRKIIQTQLQLQVLMVVTQ